MKQVDCIIHARWVVPIEPQATVLEHHAVVVHEGKIVALQASDQLDYASNSIIHRPDHVLMPGLVNVHTHAAMSLMRGIADDLPLMEWLQNHIWPIESKHIGDAFVHDGTQLAIAEMLRGGTTCFNDMYFFPEATARAAQSAGMRTSVGMIFVDFPTTYAKDTDEYVEKALALYDELKNDPLVATSFAPHAPYTVSDATLTRIATLANELDRPVHIHVHETAQEISDALAKDGTRPLARLDDLGLVNPNLLAVHMTQLTDEEIQLIADKQCSVAHCPESNLKLASGFCPVTNLWEAGVNVAIGTDGAASNNDLDLWGELKTAALLAKAVANDASALPAADALRMATLNGAKAIGLGDTIGSLTVGKAADLIAVDLSDIDTQPLYDPLSQLVYALNRRQVSDTWVNGQLLYSNQQFTHLDEAAIYARTQEWAEKIRQK